MGRAARAALSSVLLVGVTVLFAGLASSSGAEGDCSTAPVGSSVELVYRLDAGEERVTPAARDQALGIVCERLAALVGPEGQVSAVGARWMRVLVPDAGSAGSRRTIEQIGGIGQVHFYDWEPNLIGPERAIGAHPGRQPPARALRRMEREWRAAGRNANASTSQQLIFAGALPTAYAAVRLASEQGSSEPCPICSASTPRFYLFGRAEPHRLLAGPATTKADLHRGGAGESRGHPGVVLRVPVGTAIVSELPSDRGGRVDESALPGWFALRDRPALTGADIVDPRQETGEFGEPTVTFGFTREGQIAFQRVTRAIAHRGWAGAIGPVTTEQAEALSGHFAIVLNGEVKTRPIVNFTQNPQGIDGRTGAQIAGGFDSVRDARDLATILSIGGLPISLALVREQRR